MSLRTMSQRLGFGQRSLDITHGRLRDNIWQLSWPLMISSGLSFFPGLYDAYWLGRLGPYALGAATLAISLRITLISVLMALSGASAAVISRFVGARDHELANRAATQAILLFVIASGGLGILGLIFLEPLLTLAGASGDLLAPTIAYGRVIFVGLIAMEMVPSMGDMLSSSGNPQLSLQMNLLTLFSFLVLEPLLIGLGWGVTGAALALVLANTAGMFYGLYPAGERPGRGADRMALCPPGLAHDETHPAHRRARRRAARHPQPGEHDPHAFHGGLRRGAPGGLQPVRSADGVAADPRQRVGRRRPGHGGAKPRRTAAGARRPRRQPHRPAAVLVASLLLGLLAIFAEPVMALFTQDPATIAAGVHAIRVLALYRVLMTLGLVMDGGLTGAGDTVSPMVVNFIALWLVMLPAVWLLSTYFGWGVNGIWWGLVIGMGVQALLMTLRFRQGRWQQRRI